MTLLTKRKIIDLLGRRKRILITGGSGFLGSHLAKKLLERGEEVICLDNFFTGTKKNHIKIV